MNRIFDELIARFREAQDLAVYTLTERLRIPRPATNYEWPDICDQHELRYRRREIGGIVIYGHGFGIEVKLGDTTVDFDWGEHGEGDGFDGWRLYMFIIDNRLLLPYSHHTLNHWLEFAEGNGELIEDRYLYYDPKRRAKK